MRAASFSVTGDGDGREADIAVIPLGGSGGAQLMILNQWRATLRLEAAMNLYGNDMDEDTSPLEAVKAYVQAVKDRSYPAAEHCFS